MPKAQKQALSPEEHLTQALVPEGEQPYAVPENWIWVRFGYVVLSSDEKADSFLADTKYVGLEHIEKDNGIVGHGESTELKSLKNVFVVGDILYGKLRPYLNKHDITKFDGVCSTDILVFKPVQHYDIRLVNYFLDLSHFIEFAVANSKGINLPRVSKEVVFAVPIPLPPLAEQHRIVTRVESLFEKLDRAKELVQSALGSFENRKVAILHKAFTGKLTAKWREENGVGLDSWGEKSARDVCGFITKGETPTKFVTDTGDIPFLKVYNIRENKLDFNYNSAFIPIEIHKEKMKRSIVYPGDVIMNIVGPPLQKVAIVTDQYPEWNVNQAIAIFRPKESVLSGYLYHALLWEDTLAEVLGAVRGVVGQSNISLEQCRDLQIPIPTLPEQREIVGILDRFLVDEKRAQEFTDTLNKINHMKKSILARAFRGELGTNNSDEESAIALLKSPFDSNSSEHSTLSGGLS